MVLFKQWFLRYDIKNTSDKRKNKAYCQENEQKIHRKEPMKHLYTECTKDSCNKEMNNPFFYGQRILRNISPKTLKLANISQTDVQHH